MSDDIEAQALADLQKESAPEQTQTETPPANEQQQQETQQQEKTEENPAPPAYTPNFKVKALDKELEVDELFRPIIKDSDTEKKVKELYEKSLAMDHFKGKYSTLEEQVKTKYEPVLSAVQEAAAAYQAKDFDTFFDLLKIPQKEVLQWVAEKIKYEDLPEEEKRRYDESRQVRTQASQLERQNQLLTSRYQEQLVQARAFELDQVLAKNEVKEAASVWDSIYGPGAFKSEVQKTGSLEFYQSQKDLSATEAVSKTLERMKPVLDRLKAAPASQADAAPGSKPRVIPALNGRGGSPAKPVIKSLDDIRKIAASMD